MPDNKHAAKRSQAETVYRNLHGLISTLELRPGQQLSENPLAKRFGVSRTPIRQALQSLEKEGLVTRSHDKGLMVSNLSPRDVNEICDLRQILDTYIFQRAANRISTADVHRLEQCAEQMLGSAKNKDIVSWSEADREFHNILNNAADNIHATKYAEQLRSRLQHIWIGIVSRQSRLEECSVEHKVIAQAIRESDLHAISGLVLAHITHMRESLLMLLEEAAPLLGLSPVNNKYWEDI